MNIHYAGQDFFRGANLGNGRRFLKIGLQAGVR